MGSRVFGHIAGYPPGYHFETRKAASEAGVHRPTQAGISGSQEEGSDSIVLSGGYEDDLDQGSVVIYTGHGGRDQISGLQIADQSLTRGNQALARSKLLGLPIRVLRGHNLDSEFAPHSGYRYDGLYMVEDYWRELGISGYLVWRYRLVAVDGPFVEKESRQLELRDPAEVYTSALRKETTILRIVRDSKLTREVKELYTYHCQICEIRIEGSAGPYAEAAHIRPLGRPHNGPDHIENLLCLCPNHHVLLDYGGVSIADDFRVLGEPYRLQVHPRHPLNPEHFSYHRDHYYRAI